MLLINKSERTIDGIKPGKTIELDKNVKDQDARALKLLKLYGGNETTTGEIQVLQEDNKVESDALKLELEKLSISYNELKVNNNDTLVALEKLQVKNKELQKELDKVKEAVNSGLEDKTLMQSNIDLEKKIESLKEENVKVQEDLDYSRLQIQELKELPKAAKKNKK